MTRTEAERQTRQMDTLRALGFTREEAEALRRISMTLHRWYELECGDSNNYGSWSIERDENGDGPPFMVHHHYRHGQGNDTTTKTRIPDRESGAKRRLHVILTARNARIGDTDELYIHASCAAKVTGPVSSYIQTDPRGAALYILRPGDVPEGGSVEGYYSRGVCIY